MDWELILSDVLLFVMFGAAPATVVWGWARLIRHREPRTRSSVLARIGLSCATLSALLACASVVYARSIPGHDSWQRMPFPLMIIDRAGSVLAVISVVAAIPGTWQRNLVRWHALVGAIAVLIFWLASGMGM